MKAIFTFVFLFSLYTSQATNYYFSTSTGDDSRTSVQARSASTPWKTLAKLNSVFSSLQPGDQVLLKRGETFFGSIIVKKSGTSTLPIVIGAYGTGSKPVITSLVAVNSWVSKGNGIWESHNETSGVNLNTVLINNQEQEMGRYPNSNIANKGYLTLDAATNNSITDQELSSSKNWTGAEVVIRQRRWVTDRCVITNHSGSTINYTAVSSYASKKNYGYFIQNDIKTLDKFGEWYYNSSTKKLSVYFGSNTPSSYVIQAPAIDNLISATNYSNILFENLIVKGANAAGITIRNGSNITVQNCDISYSGTNGVAAYYHSRFKIENCTVDHSNDNGITFGYSGDYAVIKNNKITNTSLFPGQGGNGDGKGFGIQNNGKGSIIEYNEVINTGYVGINFNGDNTIVKNNFINSYCMTKDDGAGIYTFTGSANNVNRQGRRVIGNIIVNGIGAPDGIDDQTALVEGIYMDDNASGVEISGNTVANVPGKGVFLHNARHITVTKNTVYNNLVQLSILHDTKADAVRNCIITDNNFFSKLSSQNVATIKSIADDNNLIGKLDSNYYARPIDDRIIINNSYVNGSGSRVNENLDLEGWKARYNKDNASKRTAKQICLYKLNTLLGSNKFVNGTFSSSRKGTFESSCTISLSNDGTLDGGYLEVTPSAKHSSVFIDIAGLKANTKYILRFTAKASVSSMYINASLRKKASPYTVLTPQQNRKVDLSRNDYEMAFSSSTNETSAQIVFNANTQSKYYLDNVELYEADAIITNINDSIRFEYNPTQLNKTISLAGSYTDAKNNKYSNSVVLKPYTSAVLIKDRSAQATATETVTNMAPEVSITSPVVNATFANKATVFISADASDADGTIKKVEFYNGTTLIQTEYYLPYTYSWNNLAAGKYNITAKAIDNKGNIATSKTVSITVTATSAKPTNNKDFKINLTSPSVSASYKASAKINISANVTGNNGKIKKVSFYNGTTLLHTETGRPYSWDWKKVRAGNYTITAVATDDKGAVARSESVTISVLRRKVSKRSIDSTDLEVAEDNDTIVAEDNDTTAVINNTYALKLKKEIGNSVMNKTITMNVFPNPAVNKIQIKIDELKVDNQKAILVIYNLSGIMVKNMPLILSGKTIEADITSLNTGMYIVSIVTDTFKTSQKLIKN